MIELKVSFIGNRSENLDAIVSIDIDHEKKSVLLIDGYDSQCTEISKLIDSISSEKLSDVKTAKDIVKQLSSESEVRASILCLLKTAEGISIYSAGDCRAYNSEGLLLTKDDSNAWKDLEQKGLTPEKIQMFVLKHPGRRVLTNSLKFPNPHYDGQELYLPRTELHETFLLCTDGFWEHFKQETAKSIIDRALHIEEYIESIKGISENSSACLLKA